MLGNFYVLKHTKALAKKDLRLLRKAQNIPLSVGKHLERGVLPYITIGTVTDSWRIEFAMGMTMYDAIDEVPVAMDSDGNLTYYGNGYQNLGNLINGWFAYTSTVGDVEYQGTVIKAMQDYLRRMGEKGKEPLPEEETEKIMDEEEETAHHKATLVNMSGEILRSEELKEESEEPDTERSEDGRTE